MYTDLHKKEWQGFLQLFASMRSTEELDQYLQLFFTFEEREMMVSRYLIIKSLLEKRLTQREIARTYKVSIAQITRGSNALKILDLDFKKHLQKELHL